MTFSVLIDGHTHKSRGILVFPQYERFYTRAMISTEENMSVANEVASSLDLYEEPGHLIRRAHQIAVAMFHEKLGREVTPVQYAVLRMLYESPGLDQVTLAQRVALDTSTTAEMAARMEAKGWILREVLPRRQRKLLLTPAGEKLLNKFRPAVQELRAGLFEGMGEEDSEDFIRLLRKFVHLNNEQSRAPLRVDSGA